MQVVPPCGNTAKEAPPGPKAALNAHEDMLETLQSESTNDRPTFIFHCAVAFRGDPGPIP